MATNPETKWTRPRSLSLTWGHFGGRDRRRSGDLTLFRRALYQLSYPTEIFRPPKSEALRS